MPAQHFDTITHTMIRRRLLAAVDCHVDWLGPMPADAETWDVLARDRLIGVRPSHVESQLELHQILGDDPLEEIDIAIALAAEPPNLPDNAAVTITFRERLTVVH